MLIVYDWFAIILGKFVLNTNTISLYIVDCTRYNIRSTWFLDIRISACSISMHKIGD